MSRPQRNDTDIEAERTWFTWDAYDALPPLLRRVLANSPYDLGCGWLVTGLEGGVSAEKLALDTIRALKSTVRREARRIYGPTHPQAVRDE